MSLPRYQYSRLEVKQQQQNESRRREKGEHTKQIRRSAAQQFDFCFSFAVCMVGLFRDD